MKTKLEMARKKRKKKLKKGGGGGEQLTTGASMDQSSEDGVQALRRKMVTNRFAKTKNKTNKNGDTVFRKRR